MPAAQVAKVVTRFGRSMTAHILVRLIRRLRLIRANVIGPAIGIRYWRPVWRYDAKEEAQRLHWRSLRWDGTYAYRRLTPNEELDHLAEEAW